MLQRWSPGGEVFVGALRRWPMIPAKGFFPSAAGHSRKPPKGVYRAETGAATGLATGAAVGLAIGLAPTVISAPRAENATSREVQRKGNKYLG